MHLPLLGSSVERATILRLHGGGTPPPPSRSSSSEALDVPNGIRMCWCCCCCKVQCIPFRVLEISAMSFAVGIALMQYVYIDVWTWFVNSYTRNVLAAAVCCALLLVFAACIVMLLFRESKVSRFRKISLLCYFICFMGFLLPLAFLQVREKRHGSEPERGTGDTTGAQRSMKLQEAYHGSDRKELEGPQHPMGMRRPDVYAPWEAF